MEAADNAAVYYLGFDYNSNHRYAPAFAFAFILVPVLFHFLKLCACQSDCVCAYLDACQSEFVCMALSEFVRLCLRRGDKVLSE